MERTAHGKGNRATARSSYRTLLQLVPSVRPSLALVVLAGVGATGMLIGQIACLSWIVRDVLLRHASLSSIIPFLALAAGASLGRSVLITAREMLSRRAAIRIKAHVRERLAKHLLLLGPAYLAGRSTGEIAALTTEGVERLDAYTSRYLPQTALSILVPLCIVLAVTSVDLISAGLLLFTVPVIVLLMVLIGTFTRDHVARQWETLGRLSNLFLDLIQGLPTVLLLDRDEIERRRVERVSEQFRDRTLSVLKVAFLSGAVLELMSAAGIGLIATVLGVRLLDGGMPLDRAFFVFLLTPEFYRPLRDLGTHRHAALEGGAAAQRIAELLETKPLVVSSAASRTTPSHTAPNHTAPSHAAPPDTNRPVSIDLADVSYLYPERERFALSDVSLSLPAARCTAVVGHSGAGKTTLVNLLLRAMDPTRGCITINGVPLSALPVEAWREAIALVPQRPYLFRDTVLENIRLARPAAEVDEVVRAAELAGCLPFIEELPDGLDTRIGERGEGLSAGQRQRLAIARAFLKDAPVLILDEPTSALDPESELQIRQALGLLMRGRTVIVVAHRLATVRMADQLAVLDAGRLVEAGTHDELLRREGIYSSFLSAQRREVAVS